MSQKRKAVHFCIDLHPCEQGKIQKSEWFFMEENISSFIDRSKKAGVPTVYVATSRYAPDDGAIRRFENMPVEVQQSLRDDENYKFTLPILSSDLVVCKTTYSCWSAAVADFVKRQGYTCAIFTGVFEADDKKSVDAACVTQSAYNAAKDLPYVAIGAEGTLLGIEGGDDFMMLEKRRDLHKGLGVRITPMKNLLSVLEAA
jgi:hypothetical protein